MYRKKCGEKLITKRTAAHLFVDWKGRERERGGSDFFYSRVLIYNYIHLYIDVLLSFIPQFYTVFFQYNPQGRFFLTAKIRGGKIFNKSHQKWDFSRFFLPKMAFPFFHL
jgi:hypothetical protein